MKNITSVPGGSEEAPKLTVTPSREYPSELFQSTSLPQEAFDYIVGATPGNERIINILDWGIYASARYLETEGSKVDAELVPTLIANAKARYDMEKSIMESGKIDPRHAELFQNEVEDKLSGWFKVDQSIKDDIRNTALEILKNSGVESPEI